MKRNQEKKMIVLGKINKNDEVFNEMSEEPLVVWENNTQNKFSNLNTKINKCGEHC